MLKFHLDTSPKVSILKLFYIQYNKVYFLSEVREGCKQSSKDPINHAYNHACLQHDLHAYMHGLNSAN